MRIYVVSFIIIAVLFLKFVIEVKAETMKCRSVGVQIKVEAKPVADVENHTLGFASREGPAFFDNGETANYLKPFLMSYKERAISHMCIIFLFLRMGHKL